MIDYKSKCQEIADKFGFEILIEDCDVYLQSEDVKSHFLHTKKKSSWISIYKELRRWEHGFHLIKPIT